MVRFVMIGVVSCLLLVAGGCQLIGVLGSPAAAEIKNPAEYDLKAKNPQHVLVLAEQGALVSPKANVRLYLTKAMQVLLEQKVKLKGTALVPYNDLLKFRQSNPNADTMSPVEVGKAVGADMVVYLIIDDFRLYGYGDSGYHKVDMAIRSGLYDVATGAQVWPAASELKAMKVALDTPTGAIDNDAALLAQAAARCVVRNLYECPKAEARVAEETVDDLSGAGNF